jgi:hypothetical protein
MKKIIIVVTSVIVILLIIIGVIFVMKAFHPATPVTTGTNPFGQTGLQGGQTTGTVANTVKIQTRAGDMLSVPDFTTGHPSDKESNGTYYDVTQDSSGNELNPDFSIVYGTDSSVSIGLLAEPLSQARLHAEAMLRKLIPLTDAQLCALDVSVMVPASVSDVYAGTDVGLSFCPGAVKLP